MAELLQANWILLLVALLIGVLVAWWLFGKQRRTTITRDESAGDTGPAKRNQALMDAAPATMRDPVTPTPAAEMLAGAGIAAAAAAEQEVERAEAKASPPPAPTPAPATAPVAASLGSDDLTRIKGVGPKLAALLGSMDVTSFAQIAAWDDAEVERVDAQLGRFQGRIRRDDWREQARLLAGGDMTAYEARFGKL